MPQPYLDLPQPEDDFDERLVADVRNHGLRLSRYSTTLSMLA